MASCQVFIVAPKSFALKSVARSMARAGSDSSRAQRVWRERVISTQLIGNTFWTGLASHSFSTVESKGSFRIAPSGRSAASSPVLTPGGAMSHGTLAPGVAVIGPMLARIHSVHTSNGAIGVGVSEPPLPVLPSLIESSSSERSTGQSSVCVSPHYSTHYAEHPKNGLQGKSEDTVSRPPGPPAEGPWHASEPALYLRRRLRSLTARTRLAGSAGLEEGDDLSVYVGEPLDEDQMASVIKDPQLRAGDGPGEGGGVGDGHAAIFGAVDHQRRGGYVPDVSGEVEAGACPGLLVVGAARGRVREAPAHDLLELILILGAVGLRGRRLQTPANDPLGAEGTPSQHARQRLPGHRLWPPTTVAGADEDQAVHQVGPEERQLLRHEAAERSSKDVGLLHTEVIQERHHVK